MNDKIPTATSRIHPLVAGAAISVTLLSLVGTAAIAGWLPTSNANSPAASQLSAPVPATAAAAQDPSQYPAQYAPAPGQQQFASTQGQQTGQAQGQYAGQAQGQYAGQQQAPHAEPAPAPRPRAQRVSHAQPAPRPAYQEPAPAPRQAEAHGPNYVGIGTGAVIGGLLGNQVGKGKGRTLATIAGAIGGGYLGNEVQERSRQP
ncbi:glycine zipper 2TM domain-containing protein [Pseudoduganella sp. UC29_106]|uniref:glycine zipper 2TM domain-containing protein n=1 Tax=Pseudoduganella sp. UC29_106 TaxID=3374553 RepID=UPI003757D775